MPRYVEKYTAEQREAMGFAFMPRAEGGLGLRPASRVVALAQAGELTLGGERLPSFETNDNTVRDCARKLSRRREGKAASDLAKLPPRDAVEALRRRLVNAADSMTGVLERQVARAQKKGEVSGQTVELARQISRLVLEASRIPGPKDPAPLGPNRRDGEGGRTPETRGGMAGALLQAHQRDVGGSPARQDPEESTVAGNGSGPDDAGPEDPAAFVAAAAARLEP